MLKKRWRNLAFLPMTAAIALGSLMGASSVLAVGTCPGRQIEYAIPSETQTVSPLEVYDVNDDGVICTMTRGKKTYYGDNNL